MDRRRATGLTVTSYWVRLYAIRRLQIFSSLYIGVPGHQELQNFVGWGFAIIGQPAQRQQQVFIELHTVGLGRFHQRVYNSAGLCTLDAIAEQPILSAQHE